MATVLMYLNDDPLLLGGETAFPEARLHERVGCLVLRYIIFLTFAATPCRTSRTCRAACLQ